LHRRVGGRLRRRHARPREWLDGVAAADPAHVAGRAGPPAGYRCRRELLLSGPSRVAEDGGASADHGRGRRLRRLGAPARPRPADPRTHAAARLAGGPPLRPVLRHDPAASGGGGAARAAARGLGRSAGRDHDLGLPYPSPPLFPGAPVRLLQRLHRYRGPLAAARLAPPARNAPAAAHGTDIYADFKRSWGTEAWVTAYIYPPFFAELLAPLTPLGLLPAARIWLLVVHAAFIGSLTLILRLHPELSRAGRRLVLLAAFGFMPVYLNLKFQQVATLWLLLLTASLWAALRRRDHLGGAVIAMAASLKVTPIFLIPLFARLGRLRLAISAGMALLLLTVVTVLASPGSWQFFNVVLPRIGLGTANWD